MCRVRSLFRMPPLYGVPGVREVHRLCRLRGVLQLLGLRKRGGGPQRPRRERAGMTQLNGKVALVTGPPPDWGAAVAQVFAERGATVYGIARDAERMATVFESVPGGAYASVDITSAQACRDAVAGCVERFGRLDVLVNARASTRCGTPCRWPTADWDYDLAVKPQRGRSTCAVRPCRTCWRVGGNIVNVTSIAGVEGEVYSAGTARQTRTGRADPRSGHRVHQGPAAGQRGVPGGMLTPQVTDFVAPDNADFNLIMRIAAPRGMMAPADVAKVIAFLASDDAAAIHGAIYNVDNGKTAG